ncbi:MAG TPA: hypothetical protein VF959_06665, partial [Casimicrobiaceae bacterium]
QVHITPARNSAATKMRGGYNVSSGFVAILLIAPMCVAQRCVDPPWRDWNQNPPAPRWCSAATPGDRVND